VRAGEILGREALEEARARHEHSRAELPQAAQQMSRGEPVIPTIHV
jgi:nicotinate phosphoribosyltransferase